MLAECNILSHFRYTSINFVFTTVKIFSAFKLFRPWIAELTTSHWGQLKRESFFLFKLTAIYLLVCVNFTYPSGSNENILLDCLFYLQKKLNSYNSCKLCKCQPAPCSPEKLARFPGVGFERGIMRWSQPAHGHLKPICFLCQCCLPYTSFCLFDKLSPLFLLA